MVWARTSRQARGYDAAWDKIRARIMRRDKRLCQPCQRQHRTTVATEVNHIKAKAEGGTDDEANLEAICGPCHRAITTLQQGKRPKMRFNAEGWPIDG